MFKKDFKERDFNTAIEDNDKPKKSGVFGFLKKKKDRNNTQEQPNCIVFKCNLHIRISAYLCNEWAVHNGFKYLYI